MNIVYPQRTRTARPHTAKHRRKRAARRSGRTAALLPWLPLLAFAVGLVLAVIP